MQRHLGRECLLDVMGSVGGGRPAREQLSDLWRPHSPTPWQSPYMYEMMPICTSSAALRPGTTRGPPESPGQKLPGPAGKLAAAHMAELFQKVLYTGCSVPFSSTHGGVGMPHWFWQMRSGSTFWSSCVETRAGGRGGGGAPCGRQVAAATRQAQQSSRPQLHARKHAAATHSGAITHILQGLRELAPLIVAPAHDCHIGPVGHSVLGLGVGGGGRPHQPHHWHGARAVQQQQRHILRQRACMGRDQHARADGTRQSSAAHDLHAQAQALVLPPHIVHEVEGEWRGEPRHKSRVDHNPFDSERLVLRRRLFTAQVAPHAHHGRVEPRLCVVLACDGVPQALQARERRGGCWSALPEQPSCHAAARLARRCCPAVPPRSHGQPSSPPEGG